MSARLWFFFFSCEDGTEAFKDSRAAVRKEAAELLRLHRRAGGRPVRYPGGGWVLESLECNGGTSWTGSALLRVGPAEVL